MFTTILFFAFARFMPYCTQHYVALIIDALIVGYYEGERLLASSK
jgi:hypothetical protein